MSQPTMTPGPGGPATGGETDRLRGEPLASRRRELYRAAVEHAGEPLGSAQRPAVFSPAVTAQEPANAGALWFQWSPQFLAVEYTNWVEESLAHVETCYIGDWSAIGRIEVHGRDALGALARIGMNDLSSFAIGQIKHHVQLDEQGYVASEGLLFRAGEEHVVYSGGGVDWTAWQLGNVGGEVAVVDVSAETFIFEVQGPTSLFALEAATGESLRDIGFNRTRMATIAGAPVRILRSGISGELGYEVHGAADDAATVWQHVVDVGAPHGIRRLGVRSQLVAHIEAGIATSGIDFLPSAVVTPGATKLFPRTAPSGSHIPSGITDLFRRPGELGWGRRGSLAGHDFIGREALVDEAAAGGPAQVLVGLHWDTDDVRALFDAQFGDGALPRPMDMPRMIGMSMDRVSVGDRDAGVSTSRTYSPNLRRTISLGCLAREHAEPGTQVTVLWGDPGTAQHEIRATVVALPMKPDRRRTDVTTL